MQNVVNLHYNKCMQIAYKGGPMPLLQVRDFPAETYGLLAQTAEAENRSITQQTIYLLTKALQDETCKNKLRRTNILCQIKEMNLSVADQAPSYESLIREDRDRDEGGIL